MNKEIHSVWRWRGLGFGLAAFGILAGYQTCCTLTQQGADVATAARATATALTGIELNKQGLRVKKEEHDGN